ncbi:MAG: YegS/Rv2252/BmrU family lipid kinase [Clostridia bacterium]|nr:YegS/Rv2252/BmrU family lipid kinase [Clostridia bacterium]
MEKALLIYNPTAGKESIEFLLDEMLTLLSREGFKVVPFATKGPGHASEIASQEGGNYDSIIAAGGDGTLHEVINGINLSGNPIRLGIIPGGTSNDFARALDIPRNLLKACKIIGERQTKKVDLGIMNGRRFINIAGGGNLTGISYQVPSVLKTHLGQIAYYAKSIEELPRLRPVRVEIRTPLLRMEEEIMLFLAANSRSVGGFEHLAPKAAVNDGLLDLIIIKNLRIHEFISLAAKCLVGEHIDHPKVLYAQTSEIQIRSEEQLSLNTDGEYAGTLPCNINVLPQCIDIYSPR